MVKNLQCLKPSQICYLGHAEYHAKNRTSLRGLDHDTLFLNNPLLDEERIERKRKRFVSWEYMKRLAEIIWAPNERIGVRTLSKQGGEKKTGSGGGTS